MTASFDKPAGLESVPDWAWARLHPVAQESIARGHAGGRLNSHLLPVADARARFDLEMTTLTAPEVGEVCDEYLEHDDDRIGIRRYVPDATAQPESTAVIVYFHGGGWVIGSHVSDDPLCRDLCVQADTLIISVNYRHAPEARFPAAADDGFAALRWVAENAASLGGDQIGRASCRERV